MQEMDAQWDCKGGLVRHKFPGRSMVGRKTSSCWDPAKTLTPLSLVEPTHKGGSGGRLGAFFVAFQSPVWWRCVVGEAEVCLP